MQGKIKACREKEKKKEKGGRGGGEEKTFKDGWKFLKRGQKVYSK